MCWLFEDPYQLFAASLLQIQHLIALTYNQFQADGKSSSEEQSPRENDGQFVSAKMDGIIIIQKQWTFWNIKLIVLVKYDMAI